MQPWFPFYWADYSGKTMHLTQGEHGAYMLFLRYVYTTGKPIPHERRLSIAQARLDEECANAEAVLAQFFKRKGDHWHNEKAQEVIEEAQRRHEAYVKAGQSGGKRRYNKATPSAIASLKPGPSNYNNKEKEKSGASLRASDGRASAPLKEVHPSWNGTQSKMLSKIDEADFNAYFAAARLNVGPPISIEVDTPAVASLIERKFGSKLRTLFGAVEIEVVRQDA